MFEFLKKDRLQEIVEASQKDLVKDVEKIVRNILVDQNTIPSLKKKIQDLKDEIADLQTTKKQEQRDIEHLVKCKEKKMELEAKEKELALQEKYNQKEMELQTKFHKDSLAILDTARKEMKEVYDNIMKRLPNVNARLNIGDAPSKKKD